MSFFSRLFNRKKSTPGVSREPGQGSRGRKWWQFWKKKQPEPYEPEEEPEEPSKEEREAEEAEEKKQDQEKREQDREKARDTFNERYGTHWSKDEYNRFYDVFGDPIYNQTFGSTVLIYASEFAADQNIPFNKFVEIVDATVQQAQGMGWNQQEATDHLYANLRQYIDMTTMDDFEDWVDDLI